MKKLIAIAWLSFSYMASYPAWAHHSKEHTMLMQDAEQVIAETQQGATGASSLLIWLGLAVALGLGIMKLFNKK
jgi:hypothetical protein